VSQRTTPHLLETRSLTVYRGDQLAVDDVDLTLDAHEILALVGPSGCGKTSFLRSLAGFERPIRGTIEIGGIVVSDDSRWLAPETRQVGLVFQHGALFPHLNVSENIRFGIRKNPHSDDRVRELLALTRTEELATRFPDELSGGQSQLVALARALAPAPRVILFDEPFANLDVHLRADVRRRICDILRETRTAALFVTHDQEEALSIADRVIVMLEGRVLQDAPAQTVYDRPADLGVAQFIGVSQFIEGRANHQRVDSLFGPVVETDLSGPVRILIRPEDIRLEPGGVEARICGKQFFGHDVVQEIELSGGERLAMRVLHGNSAENGDLIRIGLREKRYQVFPIDTGSSDS